jgi:hypothetical protein
MQKYQKTLHLKPTDVLSALYALSQDYVEYVASYFVQSYQFPTGLIMQVSVFGTNDNNVGFVAYLWDANSNLINMSETHTDYLGKYTVTNPYTQDVYTLILDNNCKDWITFNTEGYALKGDTTGLFEQLYMPKSEVNKLNILLQTPVEAHGKLTSKNKILWEKNVTVDADGYWYLRMTIEADRNENYPYVLLQLLTPDGPDGDKGQFGTHKATAHKTTENKPANILGAYELANEQGYCLPDFYNFYIGTTD